MAYDENRDIVLKLDLDVQYNIKEYQEYAQVLRLVGKTETRCEVRTCVDLDDPYSNYSDRYDMYRCNTCCVNWDDTRRFRRNKLDKKVLIAPGDIVLIRVRHTNLRNKADILHKYTLEEARKLKAIGELPNCIRLNEG